MVSIKIAHGTPIALKGVIPLQDYMPGGGTAPCGAHASFHFGSKHPVCTGKDQHGREQSWGMAAG